MGLRVGVAFEGAWFGGGESHKRARLLEVAVLVGHGCGTV